MKRLLALLWLPLLLPLHTVLAAPAPMTDQAVKRQAPAAVILVRIIRLSGTGPDGAERVLFEDPKGFVTTLDTLGRVGYQVSANQLAEGGYHTLFVDLADSYEVIGNDGVRVEKSMSASGRETHRRIRGMIMIRNGAATPLRMLKEPLGPAPMRSYGHDDDD